MKIKSYLEKYSHLSYKKKLILIISLFIVLSISAVTYFSYHRYSTYFATQTREQTQQVIDQIRINVDTYIDELFRLTLTPYYNDKVVSLLETSTANTQEHLEKQRVIENYLGSVMMLPRDDILRVYILTEDDIYSNIKTPYDMEGYSDYQSTSWYKNALVSKDTIFIPVHSEKVFGNNKTQVFSIVKSLWSPKQPSRCIGVIKVDASYSGIKDICDQYDVVKGSSLFIIDDQKNIVYKNSSITDSSTLNQIYSSAFANRQDSTLSIGSDKYLLNTTTISDTKWRIVAVSSVKQLNSYFSETATRTFLISILCVIIAFIIVVPFVKRFLKPLFKIVDCMKQVQDGNLKVRAEITSHDEIGYLAESFNSMITQVNNMMDKNTKLVKEIYEAEYLHKESQYEALCSQIKPHFLYNMLNTISLLIKCKEYSEAVKSIENLSFFLRGVVNVAKNISLAEELKIVTAYLDLQKSRYGSRISYEINIDPRILEQHIPALTLQPLVENSVIHGCESSERPTLISIYSSTEEGEMYINIKDNGVGIDKDVLFALQESLKIEYTNKENENKLLGKSIGLTNVNNRIKLKYGALYGISINSVIGEGTCIQIKLPYMS